MARQPKASNTSVFRNDAFAGKVVGVTGAAHGIGEATVKFLARLGASVIAVDPDKTNLERVETDLAAIRDDATCFAIDVSDRRKLDASIRATEKKYGRIDGWVNNGMINRVGSLDDQPIEEFARAIDVNLVSSWHACKLVVPAMIRHGGGAIVNVSSCMARATVSRNAGYTSSKAGLEGLTRALAVELAPQRVRVNTITPGYVDTIDVPAGGKGELSDRIAKLRYEMRIRKMEAAQPWPQRGHADEVATAIAFLLSDAASFITGTSLVVDGGCEADLRDIFNWRRSEVARDLLATREEIKRLEAQRGVARTRPAPAAPALPRAARPEPAKREKKPPKAAPSKRSKKR